MTTRQHRARLDSLIAQQALTLATIKTIAGRVWGDCNGNATYLTTVSIPAGLFDDDPGTRSKLHVFVGSKVPRWEIADGLPQHDRLLRLR
jgi:hypothetical protein